MSRKEAVPMYSQSTREIWVTVEPIYLDDQSTPEESHFVWAYHVRIENRGKETAATVSHPHSRRRNRRRIKKFTTPTSRM